MEVAAGFTEHVDVQVGRLVDEIERLGYGDNTLIFYIWGDNGSSAEGQNGTHQRAAGAERHPDHHRAAHRGAERARRARRARLAEDRQHVSRRLGLGRQHALQGHQARRLALRRHAQPDGGALAGEDQARRDAAPAVPPRQRHRPDDLRGRRHHAAARGQRRPAGPDRRRQLRLHLRRREGARAASARSISRSWAAAPSITTAGWRRAFGPRTPWVPGLPPGIQRMDARQGQVGALQPRTRTGRRPTTSPTRCRRSSRR